MSVSGASEGNEQRALISRASIVAGGTLFSRVLGLVREQVLAALFSRASTDVFFVAFLIPNVLRQLLAEGAVQNGVLPVLTRVQEEQGEARAKEFFRALRGLSLLILAFVTVMGVLLAPVLVELFAGGASDEQFERTVTLTRWVFPYVFFMGTAALGVAALNTYRRFVVTSFAPALLNVAFIVCALALPWWLRARGLDTIYALALGVLSGGFLQVIAQWPSLSAIGFMRSPTIRLADPNVREVLRRMTPVLFGFGIYYMDVVVGRHLLSTMGEGAQSYFGFALRLCDFPQGIFVMAVQTATLPSLATLASRKNYAELIETFGYALRLALFVAIPASVLFAVLSEPIVALVFQRGHFDAVATGETAQALFAQGLGIWLVAGVRQVVIVFYALGDTRSPVLISAADFAVFLVSALLLSRSLGHVGVSYAVSIASAAQFAMLAFILRRKLGRLGLRRIGKSMGITVLSSVTAAAAGLCAAAVARLLPWVALQTILPGLFGCSAFALVFLLAAAALRSAELEACVAPIRRRLSRR